MNGLVQPALGIAERGGGQHANGTGDHRRFVGQDVAENVARHDDVELRGILDQLLRGVVHQHVDQFHVGVVLRHFVHRLSPQAGGVEHVRLVDGSDLLSPAARHFKGDLSDARHFLHGVLLGVPGVFAHFRVNAAAPLAEVDAADEFAHDDEVHAPVRDVLAQGGSARQGGEEAGGAHVGVEPHRLADAQKSRLGTFVAGQRVDERVVHLRAHRAEQHGVGGEALFHRLRGQRFARFPNGASAHQAVLELKFMAVQRSDLLHRFHGGIGDLGADAVACQYNDMFLHKMICSFKLMPPMPANGGEREWLFF